MNPLRQTANKTPLTPLIECNHAHSGKVPAKPAMPKAAGAVTSPSDRRVSGTAIQALQSVQEKETSQIITSPLIVQPVPRAPQVHQLPDLRLENLDSNLFIAQDKIRDQDSGGSTLVFKLRPEFNIVQNTSLEDFWQKWISLKALNKKLDYDGETNCFFALIPFFATEDVFCQFCRLISAADKIDSSYHLTKSEEFQFFRNQYETSVIDIDLERTRVSQHYHGADEVLAFLGYSVKFRPDGVFLSLPDPRLLHYRLDNLYKERPFLPRVKINYCSDEISALDFIKSYAAPSECADALVSTGRRFVSNMVQMITVVSCMLEAETKKDDSYSRAMAVFREAVAHYYTLIYSAEDKFLHYQHAQPIRYHTKINIEGITKALKLAKLNLATFIEAWFIDTNLSHLNSMTKETLKNLLLGKFEFACQINYSKRFEQQGETFNSDDMSRAWNTLSDFLNT